MSDHPVILQKSVEFRDPHDCTDSGDALALLDAVFDAPVRRRPDGGYAPALAERWAVSPDARTWTLTLRSGLTFHDGRSLDASVMAASIARMQRPDVGATLGAPAVWGQYLGGAKIAAPYLSGRSPCWRGCSMLWGWNSSKSLIGHCARASSTTCWGG
jgi:peptide/nickel transport system substrate-binding protein